MIDPAKPFATTKSRRGVTEAVKDELTGVVERARQERFRLLRMLQDARAQVADSTAKVQAVQVAAPAPPAALPAPDPAAEAAPKLQALIEKLAAVDQQIDQKQQRLEELTREKTDRLARLDEQIEAQVALLKRLGDENLERLGQFDEKLDEKLNDLQRLTAEKLDRLERLDARSMAVADELGDHADRAGRIVGQLAPLVGDAESIETRLSGLVEDAAVLPQRVTGQLERFDAYLNTYSESGQQKTANRLAEMHETMLREITDEMGQRRIDFDHEIARRHEQATTELNQRFDELARHLTHRAQHIAVDAEQAAESAASRIRKQTMAAMVRSHEVQEQFKNQLDEHRHAQRTHLEQTAREADADLLAAAQKVDERMAGLADLFDHQVDQILGELRTRAGALIDQMANTVLRLQGTQADGGGDDRQAA